MTVHQLPRGISAANDPLATRERWDTHFEQANGGAHIDTGARAAARPRFLQPRRIRCRGAWWRSRFLSTEPTPRIGLLVAALSTALVVSLMFAGVLGFLP